MRKHDPKMQDSGVGKSGSCKEIKAGYVQHDLTTRFLDQIFFGTGWRVLFKSTKAGDGAVGKAEITGVPGAVMALTQKQRHDM